MRTLVLMLLPLIFCGCTHTQLRRNTVNTSQTLTGIYEQQVLNNLAMFADNPHAIPHFAVPDSGASDVTDKGSFSASPLNEFREKVGLTADRTNKLGWTLTPITDPDKLRRMRCAYQRAVGCPDEKCVKCCELRKDFVGHPDTVISLFDTEGDVALDPMTGRPFEGTVTLEPRQPINEKTKQVKPGPLVWVYVPVVTEPDQLFWGTELRRRREYTGEGEEVLVNGKPSYVYVREEKHGRLKEKRLQNFDCRSACEIRSCWFQKYECTKLPKSCREYVGQHGNTRVWVPAAGRDQFGKLVLEILDYALKDPPAKKVLPLKEVTIYLDPNGKPSNEREAFQVVRTQMRVGEENIAAESGKIDKSALATKDFSELQDLLSSKSSKINDLVDEYKENRALPSLGIDEATLQLLLQNTKTDIVDSQTLRTALEILLAEQAKEQDAARRADAAAKRIESEAPQVILPQRPSINYRQLELYLDTLGGGR